MNRRELYPQILLRAVRCCSVLVCLLIVACAQKTDEPEQQKIQPSKLELPAASAPPPPAAPAPLAEKDCESAQRYRDNICELAKKICGTADDSVGNAAEGTYCSDAQSQCDAAKQRYQTACE
jgi:hypothetical protein